MKPESQPREASNNGNKGLSALLLAIDMQGTPNTGRPSAARYLAMYSAYRTILISNPAISFAESIELMTETGYFTCEKTRTEFEALWMHYSIEGRKEI